MMIIDKIEEKLNLHSTMVLLKLRVLYTPSALSLLSTFHYGSIKIHFGKKCVIRGLKSTFHYGSIKIKLQ